MRARVARVQGRELDRYPRPIVDSLTCRRVTDRVDRIPISDEIAFRILGSHRGFAQHVIREAVAARLALAGVGDGLGDGASGHELLAKQPHGQVDPLADQRLAALAQERCQRSLERCVAARVDEAARDEQAPGRGVDEQRRASAHVRTPVPAADLVADQTVSRGRIRDPQQRLGEAHQGDALSRVERELEHQRVDAAGTASRVAHALRERCGKTLRLGERVRRELRFAQERPQGRRLVGAI